MKIERTAVNGMPVRASWFVTPSPQSSTYAEALLTITCEVMCLVRPGMVGFGPAPVPRMTSFVPLAFFRADWASSTAAPPAAVWVAREPAPTKSVGIVARPARRFRRERRDRLDVSVTVSLLCEPPREGPSILRLTRGCRQSPSGPTLVRDQRWPAGLRRLLSVRGWRGRSPQTTGARKKTQTRHETPFA